MSAAVADLNADHHSYRTSLQQDQGFIEGNALPDVIICGDFPFPTGSAAAHLLQGHCKAIRSAGFSVGVLPQRVDRVDSSLEQVPGLRDYRGTPYWVIPSNKPRSRFRRFIAEHMAANDSRLEWLAQSRLEGVRAVLAYTGGIGSAPFLFRLRKLCRLYGKNLIAFVVEWQHPKYFRGRGAILRILDSELQRRVANLHLDGLICISRSLESYYSRRGQRTYLIPPLLDLNDPKWQPYTQESPFRPLRLLFAGSRLRDRHDIILHAARELRREGAPVQVEYLGSSRGQIAQMQNVGMELLEELGDGVRFYGELPHAEGLALARSASFNVILRNEAWWSKACFPTRVPEACALGVPLLCNLSSDLAYYLREGDNAIVVREVTVNGFRCAVQRALEMSEAHYRKMQVAARQMAELFDGSRYGALYKEMLSYASPSHVSTPGPGPRGSICF